MAKRRIFFEENTTPGTHCAGNFCLKVLPYIIPNIIAITSGLIPSAFIKGRPDMYIEAKAKRDTNQMPLRVLPLFWAENATIDSFKNLLQNYIPNKKISKIKLFIV